MARYPLDRERFAMPTLTTIKKLGPTAQGRTELALYCYLWAEFGNLQRTPDGRDDKWWFASWGEIADGLGWDRATVKRTARALQRDGLLEIKARTERSLYPCNSNLLRVRFAPGR